MQVTCGLWALLVSGGVLTAEASAAVSSMEDPLSLVAYMHLTGLGCTSGPVPRPLEAASI